MNNFNFSKNPFIGTKETKIAGNHVFKNSDGGRMSLEEVRNHMHSIKNPNIEVKPLDNINHVDNQLSVAKDRISKLRNIGKN